MLPKVVVFDLGKVLLDFDYGIAARKIAVQCGTKPEDIQRFIDHSALLFRYETGLLSSRQFYQEVCDALGYTASFSEFAMTFADIFSPIPELIELQTRLRKAGFPCHVFSNTNELAVVHIRERYPFFGNFDGYTLSFEHGAMKPNDALYQVVERQTGRQGKDILYIDDRAENIAAGAAREWQVIVQESPKATVEAVRRLGMLS